jgi:hypothetical protein
LLYDQACTRGLDGLEGPPAVEDRDLLSVPFIRSGVLKFFLQGRAGTAEPVCFGFISRKVLLDICDAA